MSLQNGRAISRPPAATVVPNRRPAQGLRRTLFSGRTRHTTRTFAPFGVPGLRDVKQREIVIRRTRDTGSGRTSAQDRRRQYSRFRPAAQLGRYGTITSPRSPAAAVAAAFAVVSSVAAVLTGSDTAIDAETDASPSQLSQEMFRGGVRLVGDEVPPYKTHLRKVHVRREGRGSELTDVPLERDHALLDEATSQSSSLSYSCSGAAGRSALPSSPRSVASCGVASAAVNTVRAAPPSLPLLLPLVRPPFSDGSRLSDVRSESDGRSESSAGGDGGDDTDDATEDAYDMVEDAVGAVYESASEDEPRRELGCGSRLRGRVSLETTLRVRTGPVPSAAVIKVGGHVSGSRNSTGSGAKALLSAALGAAIPRPKSESG